MPSPEDLYGEMPLSYTVNCVPIKFDLSLPTKASPPLDKSVGSVDIK